MTPEEKQAIRGRAEKATDSLPSVSYNNIDELVYVAQFDIPTLLAEIERLEVEVEEWKATAEVLGDKNVNKTLTSRHEMREQSLKAEVERLGALVKRMAEVLQLIQKHGHGCSCACGNYIGVVLAAYGAQKDRP